MSRAFALAARGLPTVRPNPAVGCVLVRDDAIVGEGWHERSGGPHAEDVALAKAGEQARGATAYVTLEPCAHEGRTGSCAQGLLDAAVSRVVFAAADPNPDAAGGAELLANGGVEVDGDVAPHRAREQNEVFFHVVEAGRPFVTVKLAQTLDGRAAAPDGTSRWLTGTAARRRVHALRAEADAVLVGSGTVIADDPGLDVRHVRARGGQPRPVVLDARGRTPLDARVMERGATVLTTDGAPEDRRRDLGRRAEIAVLPAGPDGGVDLVAALAHLHGADLQALLVEGGPTLAASFVREDLVDRLVLHVAPTLLGADALAVLDGIGVGTLRERSDWRIDRVRRMGPDIEVLARPRGSGPGEGRDRRLG